MLQALFTAFPFALAIVLGIAVILGPFLLHRMTQRWSDTTRAALILWMVAVIAVLNTVLIPRNLFLEEQQAAFSVSAYIRGLESASWVSRGLTLALIGFCLAVLFGAWLSRKSHAHDPAWLIGIVLALYYLVGIVTGATLAGQPAFHHNSLYIPIVLGALIVLKRIDLVRLVGQIKLILAALMVANLVAAVVNPDFAVLRPYEGQVPGINFRLYGVTAQANTLAPAALLLLILEFYSPSRFIFRWPILMLAFSNFLLAQSKTAWLTGVLILLFSYVPYQFYAYRHRPAGGNAAIRLVLLILLGLAVTGILLFRVDFNAQSVDDLYTFTGRTSIWIQTMSEFERYPLFGYGPDLWSLEYRIAVGNLAAGQAHNQFIQTLGESGIVGLVLLLAYLGVLLRFALRLFVASGGLSVALFTLIIVRCLTESPLRGVVSDWPFFIHAVLLLVLVAYARQFATEKRAAQGWDADKAIVPA